MFKFLFSAALLFGAIGAHADAAKTADAPKIVIDALHSVAPNAQVDSVEVSSLPGYYTVMVSGHVLYISADGKYLIEGQVFDIARKIDLKEERLAAVRRDIVAKIPKERRLVFAPPHPKYKVTVFTDVDCPYCRQFHKQIADYNRLGIEVDYVLYPLTQLHPNAEKQAEAVWCAPDRNSAYTAAMNGEKLAEKTCSNPLKELTASALSMGLSGTPAIISDDGLQLGGYVSPADLVLRLDTANQKAPN
jgi:thiol:disulfide interchange protein DsbC